MSGLEFSGKSAACSLDPGRPRGLRARAAETGFQAGFRAALEDAKNKARKDFCRLTQDVTLPESCLYQHPISSNIPYRSPYSAFRVLRAFQHPAGWPTATPVPNPPCRATPDRGNPAIVSWPLHKSKPPEGKADSPFLGAAGNFVRALQPWSLKHGVWERGSDQRGRCSLSVQAACLSLLFPSTNAIRSIVYKLLFISSLTPSISSALPFRH